MEAYFDNAATTPPSPAALGRFMEASAVYGNPASAHGAGFAAERLLAGAAQTLANLLGCGRDELVFTSGGTESNNLAILGARRGGVVVSAAEHPSVLEAAKARGAIVTPVGRDGLVDLAALADAIGGGTALVSVMAVNNETGAVSPVSEIGALVKKKNPAALFHVDGVQAFGKIRVPLTHVDFFTFSGHKIHAPKGVGGLYIRKGVNPRPLMHGGGHQRGLRPGTENPAMVCALAAAAEEAFGQMDASAERVGQIRQALADGLAPLGAAVNSPQGGSPYILNASFPGVPPEPLLHALSGAGVYVSAGAACSSRAKAKRSRFETAYGWPRELAESAIRFSFSRYNTMDEAACALDVLSRVLPTLARKKG